MSLRDLLGGLKNEIAPLYVVYGDAGPLVALGVQGIEAAITPQIGPPAFNLSTYRAGEGRGAEAFLTARTLPMMAAKRLVVVRDLELGDDKFFEGLVAYAKDPCPDAVVVVSGERLPKSEKGRPAWARKVRDAMKKSPGVLAQLQAKDVNPIVFVQHRARGHHKDLERPAAQLLVEVVGADLNQLGLEVDKLALYVGEAATIRSADVEASSCMLAEAVIWDLTTGIATGDHEMTLACLHRLTAGGDDPRRLLGLISWQLREICKLVELLKGRASDAQIKASVKVRWNVQKSVRARVKQGFPPTHEIMARLSKSNRHMNSHRAGAQRVLEGLVLELLQATNAETQP